MLTIIVPTLNRPDFAARLLEYYAGQKFRHTIFIGDSSDCAHAKTLQQTVEKLGGRLNVRWFDCKGINNYEVMQQLLEKVQTPYACYLADDDFLVVPTLQECIDFMEKNPDYMGACGNAVIFKLKVPGPYGDFEASGRYHAFQLESPGASERLLEHMIRYTSAFHSVCRAPMLKKAVRNSCRLRLHAVPGEITWWSAECFGELATSCSLLIQGKLKVLDSLYYARQVHDHRYFFPLWLEWLTCSTWHENYQIFREQVLDDLKEQGIAIKEGEKIFKEIMRVYLTYRVNAKEIRKKERGRFVPFLKERLRGVPGAKFVWGKLNSAREEMSLPALLKSSSPHHGRFWPIYSLIADGVKKSS